ncbi:hypothetical protein SFRURICE_018769 [Spodoptera frugiperda]|nr:hypothetical protein SFRURICE_018769 [Spodoptera frugiperda]
MASRRAPAPPIVYGAHARRGACPPALPAPAAAAPHRWRVWELDGSVRSHDRAPSAPYISPRQADVPHSAFNAQRKRTPPLATHKCLTCLTRSLMKPMLERKRRARINRCLDELKELMVSALQSEGENVAKLEKADILELTVRHLHKLRRQRRLSLNPTVDADRFRAGFTHAANEVSRCLASIPGVDVRLGTQLMTHLGHRLNDMQRAAAAADTPPASPPSPAPSTTSSTSGYVSPSPPASPVHMHTATPLDCTTSSFSKSPAVWRPW